MTKNKGRFPVRDRRWRLAASLAAPQQASAKDDFGKIVHHIETQYHVHRQHRFAMGTGRLRGEVLAFCRRQEPEGRHLREPAVRQCRFRYAV